MQVSRPFRMRNERRAKHGAREKDKRKCVGKQSFQATGKGLATYCTWKSGLLRTAWPGKLAWKQVGKIRRLLGEIRHSVRVIFK